MIDKVDVRGAHRHIHLRRISDGQIFRWVLLPGDWEGALRASAELRARGAKNPSTLAKSEWTPEVIASWAAFTPRSL